MKRVRIWLEGVLLVASIVVMLLSVGTLANSRIEPPESANINWQQCAGQTIKVMLNKHYWQGAVMSLAPEFEKLTGIHVEFDVYPESEYFAKLGSGFEAGTLPYDVYMANPVLLIKEAIKGWSVNLNPYIDDPSLTDKEWYDVNDFFPGVKRAGTINGEFRDIPVMGAAAGFIYRKDVLEEVGLTPPRTFKGLIKTAKVIKEKTPHYGFVARGGQFLFVTLLPWVRSYGGSFFDKDWNANLTDPRTVEAVKDYVDILTKYGPPGITNYDWTAVGGSLASGASTLFYDSFGIWRWLQNPKMVAFDPKLLKMGPPLAGPDGKIVTISDCWSLGMSSLSKHKKAAWLFIEWATSKPIIRQYALAGVFPPRASVADDPSVVKAFGENFTKCAEESLKHAVPFPVTTEFFPFMKIISDTVQKALIGEKTVEEALAEGQKELQAAIDVWKAKPESAYRSR